MASLVARAAPPGRRIEQDLTDLRRRVRQLEARIAQGGNGQTVIVNPGPGGDGGPSRTLGGYLVESVQLASDGRTVLWVAQNALTHGPPTVIATLP